MMNNPFSPISLRRVPVRDDFGRIFGYRHRQRERGRGHGFMTQMHSEVHTCARSKHTPAIALSKRRCLL
jgi:hypothetical protein